MKALSLLFGSRHGVSELYASMLMVGVTLSLGTFVTLAAVGQFGLAASASSLGTSLEQSSAGVRLGLVYAAASPSGSCPAYKGYQEGTALTLALYNYGTVGFAPEEIAVNSTAYPGTYATLPAGNMVEYAINLGACAHSSGQTLLVVDSSGDGVQVGS